MELPIRCAHTEIVDISTLKPHPKNDNVHSEEQIELFVDILRYQGQRRAITVSTRSQFITKGHGLLMALQKMGVKKAAVDRQEYQNEAQELADIAADNELARLAVVDPLKRRELMLALPEGFNLRLLGAPALKLPPAPVTPGCDEDEAPEVKPDPKVKLGELYELGVHRVLCADSTVKENVERLMAGEKADMVFTDPPYNQRFEGGVDADGNQSIKGNKSRIANDSMDEAEYLSFIASALKNIRNHTLGGWYVCFYRLMTHVMMDAVEKVGLKYRSIIIWKKNRPALSPLHYHNNYEPILYGYVQNKFFGDKTQQDVWEFPRPLIHDLHPTMKPVEMIQLAIGNSSAIDGLVLDPFLGSGSTLIACEKTSRRCFGMEIAPEYVQVVLERFQKFSGKKAYRLNPDGTKTLWDDIRDGKDQPPKTVTRKKP